LDNRCNVVLASNVVTHLDLFYDKYVRIKIQRRKQNDHEGYHDHEGYCDH